MKKVLVLVLAVICLTGCVNINKSTYENIIDDTIKSDSKIYNTYRKGYKFYLPFGLHITDSKDYNEVIKSDKENFYLYIDLIGYLNKTKVEYEKEDSKYFKYISNEDKTGYVKVKLLRNDKYMVEIAYNYAKIEVIVEEARINKCMTDALIVLSSINYNDAFLKSLTEDSLLDYKEETIDLFHKADNDAKDFLEALEEFDSSDYDENTPPDYDLIK